MKCPKCWTEKAYLRQVVGWQKVALNCLLLRPMKCRHCYHKFVVSWFATLGQQIHAPELKIAPITRSKGLSYAAECQMAKQRKKAA